MAENVNSQELELKVASFHISCASNIYETGKDYIGLILFQFDGNTKWVINNRKCQSGYVIFLDTEMLLGLSESTEIKEKIHSLGYQLLFGEGTMDKIVGEGFSIYQGEHKWNHDVFKKSMPLTNEVRQILVDISNDWKKAGKELNILPKKRNYFVQE